MGKIHLRITALLLAVCMTAGMLPINAFASEIQEEPTTVVTEPVTLTEIPVETENSAEDDTQPPATDAVTEPEETEPEETKETTEPEETESEEAEAAEEKAVLYLVDEDTLTAALEEAKEFIDGLTLNNDSNVPKTVVSTWKSQFTWDNEKRESNNQGYLFEWSYYNGVVFEGLDYIYDVTGEESYADYVEAYLAAMITESGGWAATTNDSSKAAAGYNATHGADCYKTASLLLDYYKITGDSRYLTMAQTLYTDLKNAQSTYSSAERGHNYNHSWASAPSYAVWLDGLYMIQPFMAEYAAHSGDAEELNTIAGRFAWIGENMFNEETGLYYHMANSSTNYYNNSNQYWGRAIGWYAAAMVDVMDYMTGDNLAAMKTQFKQLVDGMIPYQTDDGMWRQFVNVESSEKETSVTALMTYAIMKAVNNGWLEDSYAQYGTGAFAGMCDYALDDSGLHYICFKGSHTAYTAVSYDTYVNEGKGVGPFIMAYAQVAAYSSDEPADPDPSEPTDPTDPTEPEEDDSAESEESWGTIGDYVGVAAGGTDDVTTAGGDWETITEPIPGTDAVPGGTYYEYAQDTNGVDDDTGYLIVNSSSAAAMDNNGTNGVKTTTDFTIDTDKNPDTAKTDTQDYEWKIDDDKRIYTTINNRTYYLRVRDESLQLSDSTRNATQWTISNSNGQYTIYTEVRSGRNTYTYYLTPSDISTTRGTVRLFGPATVKQEAGTPATEGKNGLYGKVVGNLTYNATVGMTADEAMNGLKAQLDGYYYEAMSTPGSNVSGTIVEDNVLSWEWADTYDPNTPGDYEVTISYNGVKLGTAEVVVPESTTYYIAEGKGLYRIPIGTKTEEAALQMVKDGITVSSASDANGTGKTAIDDALVTWNWVDPYDPDAEGFYTVEILYNGTSLGTVEAEVYDVTILECKLSATEGYAAQNASNKAQVRDVNGDPIKIITKYSDGTTEENYLTVGMLTQDGAAVSTQTPGDFPGLTATYGSYSSDFTLHVLERLINDYPEYPNEGSVTVNKTAQGIDFQSSGVAKIELSASGIPIKQGVDVVLVADISNSMAWKAGAKDAVPGDGETTKWQDLQNSASQFAQILLADNEDGTATLNSLSFVIFGGYDKDRNNNSGSYTNYFDATQTVATYATTLEEAQAAINRYHISGVDPTYTVTDRTNNSEYTAQGGTNYDFAFLEAADAIDQLKADYEDNSGVPYDESGRKIYVIFMTDGAPDHYNQLYYKNRSTSQFDYYALYRNAHDAENGFENHLTQQPTVTGFTGTFLQRQTNGYYLPSADMNKDAWTNWILSDSLSAAERVANIEKVESITSIGFDLANGAFGGFSFTEAELTTVLGNLAGPDSCEVMVTNDAAELEEFYRNLANSIKEAATNARFEDQVMGSAFDLQMVPVEYNTLENGNQVTKTLTPVIEVKDYDLYTTQDYEQKLCTEDMIGDRKGTFTLREAVCFSNDGTKVYSNLIDVDKDGVYGVMVNSDGTYTISDADDNILDTDGVIYARSFRYNTGTSAVTVNIDQNGDGVQDTYELTPESFYWNMGTISTTEMALSYYVYLSGARGDNKPTAGSYSTNEQAILYYDNYLGNPCYKDTTSPVLAWQSANISFAFYLVNENGEIVVNQSTGRIGSFANKIAVTAPVVYQELMLDNLGVINSIDVASLDVFPEGYSLYDDQASYTISINSDASGDWEIIKNSNLVNSTYVTQFDPDNAAAYSNQLTSDSPDYDYTHTIVWFAVLYEVKTIPDTVVIDYGLPVDINVLHNDMFGDYGKLAGISAAGNIPAENGETVIYTTDLDSSYTEEYDAAYGKASIVETANGGTELRYQLDTSNGMQMAQTEKLGYAAHFTGPTGMNGYYYGEVTIIPATTIYYEESFVTFHNGSAATQTLGTWTAEGEVDADAVQSEDRPGFNNLGNIDANNIYGFDPAYNNFTTYSLGGAKKITVDANTAGSVATAGYAQFTFTGTGFDVISLTDSDSGTIIVQVRDSSNKLVKNLIVDNYYGFEYALKDVTYTYTDGRWVRTVDEGTTTATGEYTDEFPENPKEGDTVKGARYVWVVSPDASDTIWQVPVMKVDSLPYGTYTVKILPMYAAPYDHVGDGSYSFWMDAVRIYDPGLADNDANEAHGDDKERVPTYITLRELLLSQGDLNVDGQTEGIVFIDGKDGTTSIDDYANPGPNNETYLANGQGVSFRIQTSMKPESVHLGVKLAFGESASLRVGDTEFKTITTATDMYYDLTNRITWTSFLDDNNQMVYQSGIIVLSNTSANGVLSLTDIKLATGQYGIAPMALTEESGNQITLFVDQQVLTEAPALMRQMYYAEPEPEETIPGDVDGNENVNVDDVLALLWYVLFPDEYPIEAEADFDGNGQTNVDDVLTLLWYVLFPDEYPLSTGA